VHNKKKHLVSGLPLSQLSCLLSVLSNWLEMLSCPHNKKTHLISGLPLSQLSCLLSVLSNRLHNKKKNT
jgi:hypothetical protein